MMIPRCIFSASLLVCSIGLVQASEKTQTFVSEWTVDPWNYYGDTAAMNWRYIKYEPWDSAQGELREVRIQTEILGEYESRAEDVRIRSSFFQGLESGQLSTCDALLHTHQRQRISHLNVICL